MRLPCRSTKDSASPCTTRTMPTWARCRHEREGNREMIETTQTLPRWSVADVHESFDSRSFVDAMEQVGADSTRLIALFDEHGIRRCEPRDVTEADGLVADQVLRAINETGLRGDVIAAYVYATVTTNSFEETAQGLAS